MVSYCTLIGCTASFCIDHVGRSGTPNNPNRLLLSEPTVPDSLTQIHLFLSVYTGKWNNPSSSSAFHHIMQHLNLSTFYLIFFLVSSYFLLYSENDRQFPFSYHPTSFSTVEPSVLHSLFEPIWDRLPCRTSLIPVQKAQSYTLSFLPSSILILR